MKIVFGGDVFLGGDLRDRSAIDVIKHPGFTQADLRIVNLEQPISDSSFVEKKSTLYSGTEAIRKLRELRVGAVNLAHNHIQDKGLAGITETIDHLDAAGIPHFGAGSTIKKASEPHWIKDELAIFGYCDFDRPYLSQVVVAGEQSPGVAPLRKARILRDLSKLSTGQKAILFFHWGQEHLWLPPYHDIQLARELLEDDRVALVIGMHSHRPQGYIEHNGKRAYMCIGNLLFPNFFIAPPTQLAYPDFGENIKWSTRRYQSVGSLTYKKWKKANRVSLLVEFDPRTLMSNHLVAFQLDHEPTVIRLGCLQERLVLGWVSLLATVYRLPKNLYTFFYFINRKVFYAYWRSSNVFFRARQVGLRWTLAKVVEKCRKSLQSR